MFVCESCNAKYDELPLCEGGDKGEIVADTCTCGGNIVDAEKCKWCEEDYAPNKLDFDGYCEDCKQHIKQKYGSIENIIDFAKAKGWLGEIKDVLWEHVTADGIDEFASWVNKEIL